MSSPGGVEEAIELLYERYAHDIYRYALLNLSDGGVAKDVVQEVFLRAFRSWGSFCRESSEKTWLIGIARNYMIDLTRKKKTEQMVLVCLVQDGWRSDGLGPVEMRMMLQAALAQLRDTYRQVFVLRHVQQHSVEETAQVLGWTQSKVKTTDQRAIAELRQIMGLGVEVTQS
ncbi:RNA polymerase sigma factor [Alicyclobacillus sp. ALC3]|uniref:RNA polymerase sigma factor n=1 Tax=Alicyclobacillus sp. ALC3 TaxID=2796143 RepID=UPI002378C8CA|nr:RNA polymerase sigma factor [Alicyclobacillus sp. ALC3]WDL99219.1 RNA polymerase sigma factor [Alicyclobacillus sp. ALC3]